MRKLLLICVGSILGASIVEGSRPTIKEIEEHQRLERHARILNDPLFGGERVWGAQALPLPVRASSSSPAPQQARNPEAEVEWKMLRRQIVQADRDRQEQLEQELEQERVEILRRGVPKGTIKPKAEKPAASTTGAEPSQGTNPLAAAFVPGSQKN